MKMITLDDKETIQETDDLIEELQDKLDEIIEEITNHYNKEQ